MSDGVRWIFSFQYSNSRELSEEERETYRALGRRFRLQAVGFAVLAVLCFCLMILCLAVASDHRALSLVAFLVSMGLFLTALSSAGQRDQTGLLYRRVARRGVVDRFVPGTRPAQVSVEASDDEEEPTPYPAWKFDERFEELLLKVCGHRPAWIETPAGDDVLVSLEGCPVRRAQNVVSEIL